MAYGSFLDYLQLNVNVAKCNLGEAKRETMLASALHHESYAGQSWGLAGP